MEVEYGQITSEYQLQPLRNSLKETISYLGIVKDGLNEGADEIVIGSEIYAPVAEKTGIRIIELINPDGSIVPQAEQIVHLFNELLVNVVSELAGLDREKSDYWQKLAEIMEKTYVPSFTLLDSDAADSLLNIEGSNKLVTVSPFDGRVLISLPEMDQQSETVKGYKKMYAELYMELYDCLALVNNPEAEAGWESPYAFKWGAKTIPFANPSPLYDPKNWRGMFNKGGIMMTALVGEIGEVNKDTEIVINFLTRSMVNYNRLNLYWKSQLPLLLKRFGIGPMSGGTIMEKVVVNRFKEMVKQLIVVPQFSVNVNDIDKQLAKDLRKAEFLDWKVLAKSLSPSKRDVAFIIYPDDMQPVMIMPDFTDKPRDYTPYDILGMLNFINPLFMQEIVSISAESGKNPVELAKAMLSEKKAGNPSYVPESNLELTVSTLEKLSEILNGFAKVEEQQQQLNILAKAIREPALRTIVEIQRRSHQKLLTRF